MGSYSTYQQPGRGRRVLWAIGIAVVVAALGVGSFLLFGRNSPSRTSASGTTTTTATHADTAALAVLSSSPAAGATNVPSDALVTVHFSEPLASGSAMPTMTPAVPGLWQRTAANTVVFTSSGPLVPSTTETVTIPGGAGGLKGVNGTDLSTSTSFSFTVADGSTERLQQLLALTNYLPLSFTPSGPTVSAREAAAPAAGTFAWKWTDFPAELQQLWMEGYETELTKAAVESFEDTHGLTVDGLAGPKVWTDLLADVGAGTVSPRPWIYVYVTKTLPETLTLYNNGAVQYANIPVNTGAPGADTADGTFAVFEHLTSSEMKGTNVDGSTYDDPNVPWASYFNGGDALHGFVRAHYGYPQSNGCVEMSIADAGMIWPLTPIGTLVTVVGPTAT